MKHSLAKVKSGDPLAIPAGTYNTFVDAAEDYLKRQTSRTRTPAPQDPSNGIVIPVLNSSGADRDRFDVLALTGVMYSEDVSEEAFYDQRAMTGGSPTATDYGNMAILIEDTPSGSYGRAAVSGIVPVPINFADTAHLYADMTDGVCGNLLSSDYGSAQILWPRPPASTGVTWAMVRLGVGYPQPAALSGTANMVHNLRQQGPIVVAEWDWARMHS